MPEESVYSDKHPKYGFCLIAVYILKQICSESACTDGGQKSGKLSGNFMCVKKQLCTEIQCGCRNEDPRVEKYPARTFPPIAYEYTSVMCERTADAYGCHTCRSKNQKVFFSENPLWQAMLYIVTKQGKDNVFLSEK